MFFYFSPPHFFLIIFVLQNTPWIKLDWKIFIEFINLGLMIFFQYLIYLHIFYIISFFLFWTHRLINVLWIYLGLSVFLKKYLIYLHICFSIFHPLHFILFYKILFGLILIKNWSMNKFVYD